MKSSKVENELHPTHPGEILKEQSMKLADDNLGLPLDMVSQILKGRQERLSGQSSEYKFGEI